MAQDNAILLSALRGETPLRVPVAPLAVHFCATVAGLTLHRYTSDARALAEAVVRYHERFQPDAVFLSADTWVSAEAMGARVGPVADGQPWGGLGGPAVRCPADIDRIPAPDIGGQGRYPLMLEALVRVRSALGPGVAIVACFDQYPFSLAAALMGMASAMLALEDDPPFVRALMERCLEYALAYGRALAAAGADLLTGGDSPAGLIGPHRYREFALPFEQRLIASLRHDAAKPVSLHICGNADSLLADMARCGADGLEIDHRTDLALACRIVPAEVALWGNLDPVSVLAQGDPATVAEAARRALAQAAAAGRRRFVLSSGCTLAPETPFANLDAMIAVARAGGSDQSFHAEASVHASR